jgi:enoyl-[acyl-carrier-protein] reductase (NADH)
LPCDVEDIGSVDAVFGAVEKEWGTLDFLLHAIAFSDKNELKGRYADTDAGELLPHHGDLLLRLHRGREGAPPG